MGYSQTQIVLYGIALTEDIAKKIYNDFLDCDHDIFTIKINSKTKYYRKIGVNDIINGKIQSQIESPYSQHDTGSFNTEVFFIDLISDGTDMRIESLEFEPGYSHYFGVYIASKGYAYQDDITYFSNHIPKEAIDIFNKYCLPILKKYNVNTNPEVQLCQQVW